MMMTPALAGLKVLTTWLVTNKGWLDILGLVAMACIFYGVHQIYAPAAWVVVGILFLAYVCLATAPKRPTT